MPWSVSIFSVTKLRPGQVTTTLAPVMIGMCPVAPLWRSKGWHEPTATRPPPARFRMLERIACPDTSVTAEGAGEDPRGGDLGVGGTARVLQVGEILLGKDGVYDERHHGRPGSSPSP